jgi:hypothetical protein
MNEEFRCDAVSATDSADELFRGEEWGGEVARNEV